MPLSPILTERKSVYNGAIQLSIIVTIIKNTNHPSKSNLCNTPFQTGAEHQNSCHVLCPTLTKRKSKALIFIRNIFYKNSKNAIYVIISSFFCCSGFHVTSSRPRWWTRTIAFSLTPFVRPPEFVHFTIVICVFRDRLQTTYM